MHAIERLSPETSRRECAHISRVNNRLVTVAPAKQKQFNWSIYILWAIMQVSIYGSGSEIEMRERKKENRNPSHSPPSGGSHWAHVAILFFFFFSFYFGKLFIVWFFLVSTISTRNQLNANMISFRGNFKLGCDQINIDSTKFTQWNTTIAPEPETTSWFTILTLRSLTTNWRRTDGREIAKIRWYAFTRSTIRKFKCLHRIQFTKLALKLICTQTCVL